MPKPETVNGRTLSGSFKLANGGTGEISFVVATDKSKIGSLTLILHKIDFTVKTGTGSVRVTIDNQSTTFARTIPVRERRFGSSLTGDGRISGRVISSTRAEGTVRIVVQEDGIGGDSSWGSHDLGTYAWTASSR